jgi:hypothetical protein
MGSSNNLSDRITKMTVVASQISMQTTLVKSVCEPTNGNSTGFIQRKLSRVPKQLGSTAIHITSILQIDCFCFKEHDGSYWY